MNKLEKLLCNYQDAVLKMNELTRAVYSAQDDTIKTMQTLSLELSLEFNIDRETINQAVPLAMQEADKNKVPLNDFRWVVNKIREIAQDLKSDDSEKVSDKLLN